MMLVTFASLIQTSESSTSPEVAKTRSFQVQIQLDIIDSWSKRLDVIVKEKQEYVELIALIRTNNNLSQKERDRIIHTCDVNIQFYELRKELETSWLDSARNEFEELIKSKKRKR